MREHDNIGMGGGPKSETHPALQNYDNIATVEQTPTPDPAPSEQTAGEAEADAS